MTRADIRSKARKKLGETTGVFWLDAEINGWMEDAQKDIVWRAKLKKTQGTFTTLTDTSRYVVSAILPNCLRILGKVWIYDSSESKWRKVDYISEESLNVQYPDWPNAAATRPILYTEDMDKDYFEFYPKPYAACVGTNYVRVDYCSMPLAMTSDSSAPDLDLKGVLHGAVIDWVVATGFESRGYGDLANDHWSKYYDKIKSYLIERTTKEDEELVMKNYKNI